MYKMAFNIHDTTHTFCQYHTPNSVENFVVDDTHGQEYNSKVGDKNSRIRRYEVVMMGQVTAIFLIISLG